MASDFDMGESAKFEDDLSFSVIDRLTDTIRAEEEVKISQEDRNAIVQDLYEGPKKCQCCINWMTECPHGVDLASLEKDESDDDESNPIIVRRRVTPGKAGSLVTIHSIDIRHAATRKVLIDVFKPYDGIVHDLKYLAFLAPFHQFFWRWEAFEKAIADEEDKQVKKIMIILRSIIKRELAGAFAVSKELISHGMITYDYLWTLFPPGELIYSDWRMDGDRFFVLQGQGINNTHPTAVNLWLSYVDCSGDDFGVAVQSETIPRFRGTRPIDSLMLYPAKYHNDFDGVQKRLVERGRKFASLVGKHYKAYRPDRFDNLGGEIRVMIDTDYDRNSGGGVCVPFGNRDDPSVFYQRTQLIVQGPVDAPPSKGHVPLRRERSGDEDDFYDGEERIPPPRRRHSHFAPPPMPPGDVDPYAPPGFHHRPPSFSPSSSSSDTLFRPRPDMTEDGPEAIRPPPLSRLGIEQLRIERARKQLNDLRLSLCVPHVMGFNLKEKTWENFEVDRIHDIEWNTKPFESLVLPEGYKELILAFVESQVKEKDNFDDVINGKGGGLVALLAGAPGVGKTLTAESVAEKIRAPLFKMELGEYNEDDSDDPGTTRYHHRRPGGRRVAVGVQHKRGDIAEAFELAARWGAVLLIDECDAYLEQRSDTSSQRNRLVSRFLRELEYYPSLLFLTTNREKALDPAVHSRVHLTINYPALDEPSRQKVWTTFLGKTGSELSDGELEALSRIEVDGRKIRNIVKTASIMARRDGRSVGFDDIKKVMRITEGIEVEDPRY
ncbi:AAA family [Colletotrichum kahawae]|uniref:AAA family n=1 Tax=Colletotrichum kahawae TaxID=34407 RepID=A0AAD9XYK7_COLKA|nr:AAA family [Colletotrichum kahawae]